MTHTFTASSLRRWVHEQLADSGVPSPSTDASQLVAAAMNVPMGHLPLAPRPSPEQVQLVEQWTARRCQREPLQHILGRAAFGSLELQVGPGVFVPRPETEVLFTHARKHLKPDSPGPTIVDLCAGSGAIALALALSAPGACVYAVEVSPPALKWLHTNVDTHSDRLQAMGSSVTVVAADATNDPLPQLHAAVDLVASNPPYIPTDCLPRDPEVLRYDPSEALFGGADGLEVVRGVVVTAAHLLRPGGTVLIEHGDSQGWDQPASVPQLVADDPRFVDVSDVKDLAGRPRITIGRRSTYSSPQDDLVAEVH